MTHVQNLRVEAAKRLLETGAMAAEAVAPEVGYENGAFFRALFRRSTGLTPGQYRSLFRPLARAVHEGVLPPS
jgi:transcriptional regulator GlxA family with amidase domain